VHWADYLAERSARRWLCGIAPRLASGWRALAGDRALWPEFARHTAAVDDAVRAERELVERGERVSDLMLIAGHAHDVWTEATASGWAPPAEPSVWTRNEWTGLRLLACYHLASAEPHGPRLPRGAVIQRPASADTVKRAR
jgi:hypothetical protein